MEGNPIIHAFPLRWDFSTRVLVDILGQIIFYLGAGLVRCRMFSSIPVLCLLDADNTPTPNCDNPNVS